VGGLKPDIRRDAISQSLATLIRVVSLAKLYEEKYVAKSKQYSNFPSSKTQVANPSFSLSQTIKSTSLPPLLPSPPSAFEFHHYSTFQCQKNNPCRDATQA